MNITQKQSVRTLESRKCAMQELLDQARKNVDILINDYLVIKKLRPVFAREYLSTIKHGIEFIEVYEREIARLDENPDCPF